SGVATEADHGSWTPEQLRPFILEAVEAFGFDRLIFGGDWPVATLALDYGRWLEVLEWTLADASEAELGKLFHDNAMAFYRLGGTAAAAN
ncbi:MAG: amidohydrolase family protein, partial [Alphaproteobacteria bacterium]